MQVQGAFNVLFRPGLRKDFRDSYMEYAPEYTEFMRETTTDQAEQSAVIIAGLSRMVERGDGEAITYDTPSISPKVMGVDREFGLGFMLTRRTVEDDQYGKANQSAKWLGHAARMTKEYRAAALLDDAFAGSLFRGVDSLPLLHTAHTLINSPTTVANRPSVEVGISVTGVNALVDLSQSLKDENGDPITCSLDTFLVSNISGDYNRALQIFGSDKEPFTAENQDNAIKKRFGSTKVRMSHYKSAATRSYFYIDSKMNDAQMVVRRPVQFDDDFDFNTDAALYKATTRFLIWYVDWRGWFGANPV
jgi:hypothetical protein